MDDPIVAEVRRRREAHAKEFDYDLDAIFADLKEREAQSDAAFVSLPAKRIAVPPNKVARPHDAT